MISSIWQISCEMCSFAYEFGGCFFVFVIFFLFEFVTIGWIGRCQRHSNRTLSQFVRDCSQPISSSSSFPYMCVFNMKQGAYQFDIQNENKLLCLRLAFCVCADMRYADTQEFFETHCLCSATNCFAINRSIWFVHASWLQTSRLWEMGDENKKTHTQKSNNNNNQHEIIPFVMRPKSVMIMIHFRAFETWCFFSLLNFHCQNNNIGEIRNSECNCLRQNSRARIWKESFFFPTAMAAEDMACSYYLLIH